MVHVRLTDEGSVRMAGAAGEHLDEILATLDLTTVFRSVGTRQRTRRPQLP